MEEGEREREKVRERERGRKGKREGGALTYPCLLEQKN